jgi:hypothetical protein
MSMNIDDTKPDKLVVALQQLEDLDAIDRGLWPIIWSVDFPRYHASPYHRERFLEQCSLGRSRKSGVVNDYLSTRRGQGEKEQRKHGAARNCRDSIHTLQHN